LGASFRNGISSKNDFLDLVRFDVPFLFDVLILEGIIQEAIVFLDFENMLRVPVFNLSNFDEILRLLVVDLESADRLGFVFCSVDLLENGFHFEVVFCEAPVSFASGFHRGSFNGKAPFDCAAR
tara:strand:+ start:94 stop:465 length:372 start_codon:yes stop_codon:yes gene_type:complete